MTSVIKRAASMAYPDGRYLKEYAADSDEWTTDVDEAMKFETPSELGKMLKRLRRWYTVDTETVKEN